MIRKQALTFSDIWKACFESFMVTPLSISYPHKCRDIKVMLSAKTFYTLHCILDSVWVSNDQYFHSVSTHGNQSRYGFGRTLDTKRVGKSHISNAMFLASFFTLCSACISNPRLFDSFRRSLSAEIAFITDRISTDFSAMLRRELLTKIRGVATLTCTHISTSLRRSFLTTVMGGFTKTTSTQLSTGLRRTFHAQLRTSNTGNIKK